MFIYSLVWVSQWNQEQTYKRLFDEKDFKAFLIKYILLLLFPFSFTIQK